MKPGGVLLVHTAFSKIHPVEGEPLGLIDALREALGPDGTLVMPSMTSDDDHPFDVQWTPCPDMGVVADTFWQRPQVLRSDCAHAFAAAGPLAPQITALHPVDPPHDLNSPVGRVYERDGLVLLLGVGHDADTTVHLAEWLAGVRYRRDKYVTLLENEIPVRLEYREIDHCCQNFNFVDDWLDAQQVQCRGEVGHGETRLVRSRDVVAMVRDQLRANETIFLHPKGVDEECDDAWESLMNL